MKASAISAIALAAVARAGDASTAVYPYPSAAPYADNSGSSWGGDQGNGQQYVQSIESYTPSDSGSNYPTRVRPGVPQPYGTPAKIVMSSTTVDMDALGIQPFVTNLFNHGAVQLGKDVAAFGKCFVRKFFEDATRIGCGSNSSLMNCICSNRFQIASHATVSFNFCANSLGPGGNLYRGAEEAFTARGLAAFCDTLGSSSAQNYGYGSQNGGPIQYGQSAPAPYVDYSQQSSPGYSQQSSSDYSQQPYPDYSQQSSPDYSQQPSDYSQQSSPDYSQTNYGDSSQSSYPDYSQTNYIGNTQPTYTPYNQYNSPSNGAAYGHK
ncbi:hypothetical protein HIM_08244 [Hirsutella minnesotensis 3608]|uniref:Cyanovirin-N domain-containing protein n=1 Tax=Hirsutella minnesotensis 3608 TaxID=1043627 RepID=A0A0F7ZT14_9HYPO|nr:hypothetical protein HIM_08244 [Hirsutella minnesotensis 3608]